MKNWQFLVLTSLVLVDIVTNLMWTSRIYSAVIFRGV